MTKARSRGKIRPDNNPQPPAQGTKGWIRVIARGCGGHQYDTMNGPEYDCKYYAWECDSCPIVLAEMEEEEARWLASMMQIQGPPRDFKHPMEYWMYPATATELHWIYTNEDIKKCLERYDMARGRLFNLDFGDLLKKEGGLCLS